MKTGTQRFVLALIALVLSACNAGAERPNIVVLLADDMGYGELQCLNPKRGKIKTPQLDAIAAGGMIFTDAHTGSSVCTPTRYGLMTGRYAWRTRLQSGVLTGGESLIAKDRMTIADLLKEQGYHTAMFGKWHLGMLFDGKKNPGENVPVGAVVSDGPIEAGGFDEFGGFHHARQMNIWVKNQEVVEHLEPIEMLPRLTAAAVEFIKGRKDNPQPFFLYVPWNSPHSPVVPSPEWQRKSGLNAHGDFVMQTDDSYGQIVKALREHGMLENTLIICSSDNGTSGPASKKGELEKMGHFPSGDLRGAKASLWDGGHRVPFLVHWPDVIKPGSTCDQLVCMTDVMATCADLLGVTLPENAAEDSVSFLPALKGEEIDSTRAGVIHHSISGHFSYRLGKWKLLLARGSGGWDKPTEKEAKPGNQNGQLYDIENDLGETKNLYKTHPEIVERLLKQLESDVTRGRSTGDGKAMNDIEEIILWKSGNREKKNNNKPWVVDSHNEWQQAKEMSEGLAYEEGLAVPSQGSAFYRSVTRTFDQKRSARSLLIKQSPAWLNWEPLGNIKPVNLSDAPVLLSLGPDNYWIFGRYKTGWGIRKEERRSPFAPEPATLEGFDIPLQTTRFPRQYNAPGGLKKGQGGYHAWQSRDMINWVHHGSVTDRFSAWVTTAEWVDGKAYIYYDFPNDQDPHVYVDADLSDGEPGKNMGMAFEDPSHGSDCAIIRDLEGKFHLISEDYSPIMASKRSWDSPLASHAVSPDGLGNFTLLDPAVDERTEPTGVMKTYTHPHWAKEDPKRFKTGIAEYEVHTPEQEAFGDWAAISIGGQYYLFGDYDPEHGKPMSIAWFTSSDINKQFTFCGNIGNGHPDPDICFAEGKFYLVNQTKNDYVSPGPWVEKVEARVGVDIDEDGSVDTWTDWQALKESYDYIEGFSKQVKRIPATMDLSSLPAGYGFCFEVRVEDLTENKSKPVLDRIEMSFAE